MDIVAIFCCLVIGSRGKEGKRIVLLLELLSGDNEPNSIPGRRGKSSMTTHPDGKKSMYACAGTGEQVTTLSHSHSHHCTQTLASSDRESRR